MHADKEYVSLDEQIGKSTRHKNAVAFSKYRNRVFFMLSDWKAETEAAVLALKTVRNEKGKRLGIEISDVDTIKKHQDFFSKLLVDAKRESQRRQGYNHFAFTSSDILSLQVDGVELL